MIDDGFDNLGFYSTSLLYLGFTLGSLLSSAIIHKIGVKISRHIRTYSGSNGFLMIPE